MTDLSPPRRGVVRALVATSRLLSSAGTAVQLVAGALLPWSVVEQEITEEWEGFGESPLEMHALMSWEEELYSEFLRPDSHVLVVGCGTGRDIVALADRGHTLEGMDITKRALICATRRLVDAGVDAPLHLGSIVNCTLPPRFDAVIFSWYTYGYIQSRSQRVKALKRAAACLRPGGRLLLSYIVDSAQPSTDWRLAHLVWRLAGRGWTMEAGDRLLAISHRGRLGVHFEHQFSPQQFLAEVALAGLRPHHHHAGLHGVAALVVQ